MTPLSCGIRSGNPAVVDALIHGASKNELNDYNTAEPVLHLAIAENQGAIVDVLLEIEAVNINFNKNNTIESPPLICAVRLRNEPIFEKILNAAKVDADCPDAQDRTALWWAAALGLDSYVKKLLAFRKVREPGKDYSDGNTPISIAVQLSHLGVVRQLLRIQQPSTVGVKAILIAAKNGHTPVVEELLPYKVTDKKAAEQLLQRYGLQQVWVDIQNSTTWDEVKDEEKSTESGYDGEISESELSYASDVISAQFKVFKQGW
ncbi:ankyrin repeat-containing domain protein [Xylaria grammica]|nr:ankyrin repeat-containing domain protein [Xylaria grammica]